MKKRFPFFLAPAVPLWLGLCLAGAAAEVFQHGVVASAHPKGTEAGVAVLRNGGNAIDAAVAVALTLGVVDGANSGIGGGCFLLIRRANGELLAIDGRETAPAVATRDMFIRAGRADTALSQAGPLASGVPGCLAAYDYAVRHFGKKKLSQLLLPAADLAETGFVIDEGYAGRLRSEAADLARFPASKEIFFRAGEVLRAGDVLRQPQLAATYRQIAKQGVKWFYRGPFAAATEAWMKQNGGALAARDFRNYRIGIRQPLRTSYRGYEIVGFPPPSSGGVHVAEMLNLLEGFDLRSLAEPDRLHVIAEAMKLAFADRAYWLGDPAFAKVPIGLAQKDYAKTLVGRIDLELARAVTNHGVPPHWEDRYFKKHTTHFSVADAEGNWVACTTTVNTSFGSKVVIPGTGVILNNQMDDFSIQPGVTNYFGLIGAEANAIAPGKRPLSSMTPTLVLRDGRPIVSLGASGGPKIISTVLLELVDLLDLGLSPEQAVAQPRIHHQWFPNELYVESGIGASLQADLARRGHHLKVVGPMSLSQMVMRSPSGAGFVGAADPRGAGRVAGW